MENPKLLKKFIIWSIRHIKQRHFILILSFLIGILSGLAAVILKNILHYTTYFLTSGFDIENESYFLLLYPILGLLLTVVFVKLFVKDDIGHGVSKVLYSISKKNSIIKRHNNWSSILASALTISFGGSVGSEAPIVLTGASLGSNIGRLFHLNYKTITLLVGCGASGAIAGIFKAPIAGFVFTIEILMLDLTMTSLVPLLISAVTAAIVAYFLMGAGTIFPNANIDPFVLSNIPYYIILGVISGFVSLYVTKGSMYIESKIHKIENVYKRIAVGGIILGVLIFIFPPLYGEGYETLKVILSGDYSGLVNNSLFYSIKDNNYLLIIYLLLILFFKVIAMAVTNGAGGVGGVFAPTLFMGGVTGFVAARIINTTSLLNISESNFALVGMGGLMAGVMHAPLTGIFLIAEITGGYGLLIPLIITATISYLTIMLFEPHSIYTKRLAQRGELMTHDKDKAVLSLMKVDKLIETNFNTIKTDATLGELVKVISKSQRNVFPVVDDENNFHGLVFINDIRNIVFKTEMYDTTYVRDLMFMPDTYVTPDESMEDVAKKFSKTGKYNIPVLKDGKYIGFVSRAKVFSSYRNLLKDFSED